MWCMYSVLFVHDLCGQFGMRFFLILCKWLLIGAWPVHSWVSPPVCLRLSELVIFMYLSEGSEGSIRRVRLNLGDSIHHSNSLSPTAVLLWSILRVLCNGLNMPNLFNLHCIKCTCLWYSGTQQLHYISHWGVCWTFGLTPTWSDYSVIVLYRYIRAAIPQYISLSIILYRAMCPILISRCLEYSTSKIASQGGVIGCS